MTPTDSPPCHARDRYAEELLRHVRRIVSVDIHNYDAQNFCLTWIGSDNPTLRSPLDEPYKHYRSVRKHRRDGLLTAQATGILFATRDALKFCDPHIAGQQVHVNMTYDRHFARDDIGSVAPTYMVQLGGLS